MIEWVVSHADLTIFPRISLVIFVAFFVLMVVWVYRRGAKNFYGDLSNKPFEEAIPAVGQVASSNPQPSDNARRDEA